MTTGVKQELLCKIQHYDPCSDVRTHHDLSLRQAP